MELSSHITLHPWANNGVGSYKLMQQIVLAWDVKRLKEEHRKTGLHLASNFLCWSSILPRLNLERAEFHLLSKRSSSGFWFWFTDLFFIYIFFLKVCFHLPNTFINVFRAFGGVRLSLFSTLFLLFFLAKRLKGGDSKNKFLVFFLF